MARDHFAFVPTDEVDDFVASHNGENDSQPLPPHPPALPEGRSHDEILAMLPQRTVEEPAPTPSQTTRPDRPRRTIRIKTSDEQLAAVSRLFHEHNDTLPGSEIAARTRLTPSTVSRLLHKLRRGEDITKRPKRGRKPKYTPALLRRIASELCFKNKTLREAKAALVEHNMEAIAAEALPVVSPATIHRSVTNGELMNDNDLVPLSFARCTVRGVAANTEANKELRVEKRMEIDQYQRSGLHPRLCRRVPLERGKRPNEEAG